MKRSVIPLVVVSWNRASKLHEWLSNVEKLRAPSKHVIRPVIVDNASSDITPAIIGAAISQGALKAEDVHWLPSNYGFTTAQNLIFRRLMADVSYSFVATLNEDARADPDWLARLVDAACAEEHTEHRVGMWCGPIHRPAPHDKFLSSTGHCLRKRDAAFLDIDWNRPADSPENHSFKDFEPFCPCFAAALWSMQMIREVGLPDSDQFMYYDDVELGYRARLDGWRAQYVPEAKPITRYLNQSREVL